MMGPRMALMAPDLVRSVREGSLGHTAGLQEPSLSLKHRLV